MDTSKRKVTVKVAYNVGHTTTSSTTRQNVPNGTRSPSPFKSASSASEVAVFRPKAKINSSATPNSLVKKPSKASSLVSSTPIRSSRSDLNTVSTSRSAATTPRATSPVRPLPRLTPLSTQPKARVTTTLRPTAQSSIARADSRGTESDSDSRTRRASLTMSPPMSQSSPTSTPQHDFYSAESAPRITSKLSRVALSADSLSAGPSKASPVNPRTRTPSMSSAMSHSSVGSPPLDTPTFYPITTAVPAANPYRFASQRPPSSHNRFPIPFSTPYDDPHLTTTKSTYQAKIDPSSIPLPPHSPPASAVSFSSHSSISQSSLTGESGESSGSALGDANGSPRIRSALETLMQFNAMTPIGEDVPALDGEHNVRREAKSNRKIADLEITNRSLLAINATLEATKHRQAKEIRELKRRLRESMLVLPPRTYRAMKSSLPPEQIDDIGGDDEEDDEEDEDAAEDELLNDNSYKRVKHLIDDLLQSAHTALASSPVSSAPTEGRGGGAKVLSAEEVQNWRSAPSPSLVALPDEDLHSDHLDSEDEVELMTRPRESTSSFRSPSPSIIVTKSP